MYLAGHREAVPPAAIVSGVLFAACGGLYLFVRRIGAEARETRGEAHDEAPTEPGQADDSSGHP